MSDDLLQTKLYAPRLRPSLVPRPHLIDRLNEGLRNDRKLTLISAPAGFGKTTLVSSWIDALGTESDLPTPDPHVTAPAQIAWLSLDKDDGAPVRFLSYVIAALQRVEPLIGESALPMLAASSPPIPTVLTALLNDVAAQPKPLMLVLDDYHMVDSRPVDEALTFLLYHLPPQLHFVITTREDPNLPLPRLRVRGLLTELRAADLRFTAAETAVFLQQTMGLDLSEAQIAVLEARTEGWIAGLQMAALTMQNREDVSSFIRAFAGDNRYIVDYLAEEVLLRQPAHIRRFLLQTAILDRLSASLCDAVLRQTEGVSGEQASPGLHSQIPNSQSLLEHLEHANLFVIPLDDSRTWYRYHHLFGDVLQTHLTAEQPDALPLLHGRASRWFAQHALAAEAIRHALAAEVYDDAAALIERAFPEMDGRFQLPIWQRWLEALPPEMVCVRPVLIVGNAWAYLNSGDMEAADNQLQAAEHLLAQAEDPSSTTDLIVSDEDQFRALLPSIATARAYLTQALGDIPASVRHARRALDWLPADDNLRRAQASSMLALAQWANGELEAAYDALAAAMSGFEKAGNLYFAISGAYALADFRVTQGRLRDAVQTYEYFLRLAAVGDGEELPGAAHLYLGLAELSHQRGQPQEAAAYLQRGQEIGERSKLPDRPIRWRRVLARIKASQGDHTAALALLDEVEQLYYQSPLPDDRPVAADRARVWIRQGNLRAAERWVREQKLTADDALSYLREYEHITLTRLFIAQHQHAGDGAALDNALRLLARLAQAAEVGGRMGSLIEILVLQALAHHARSRFDMAVTSLKRALTLAEPEGYVRLFVDEGSPMAALLTEAAKRGILPDYVGRLRAAMRDDGEETAVGQPLPDPLSERELEVLKLLTTSLTGPEIARELIISLNTMRTHTKNIYSKLGVNSRRTAVRRAEELRLL